MTFGWFLFGVVEPLVLALLGWLAARWHLRSLRREDERRRAAEASGSSLPDEAFDGALDRPRSGIPLADRIAELEQTLDALIAGASGWPMGLIDPAIRRLEAQIEVLQASDEELRALPEQYQRLADRHVGNERGDHDRAHAPVHAQRASKDGRGGGEEEDAGMLTAHQRVAITAHLPEVVQADVREGRGDVVDFVFVRLELASGSKIAIYGLSEDGS